jgi:hypothetical protein
MDYIVFVHTVASVSSSPSGTLSAIRAINWIGAVYSSLTVKSAGKTSQAKALPVSSSTAPSGPQTLPLGLLMSVGQPSGGNARAGLDYAVLRNALRSDNLTAAQQAYTRLQSDLLLGNSANSTTADNVAGGSGHLDISV